jgi:hypothetical protein
MERIIEYFDLYSRLKEEGRPRAKARGGNTTNFNVLPQYFFLLLGVVIQPFLEGYMASGHWRLGSFSDIWGWVVVSAVIAFVLLPAVYKGAFDESKPLTIQLAPIFTSGLGWQTAFGTLVHFASSTGG